MIDLQEQKIFIEHDQIYIPAGGTRSLTDQVLATLITTITHYGYALSEGAVRRLLSCPADQLAAWWEDVELILASLTGADRPIQEGVVYKNFPHEVLEMSEARYWIQQIGMYWGLPATLFAQEPSPRQPLDEPVRLRVLRPSEPEQLDEVYAGLLQLPARWTRDQWEDVSFLAQERSDTIPLSTIPFKENLVRLAALLWEQERQVVFTSGTDVLRLVAVLSGRDASLREGGFLAAFSRGQRRRLLGYLEAVPHLEEDVARRPGAFKQLIRRLHPGDYADRFPRVVAAYDRLYRRALPPTHASALEVALRDGDADAALPLLRARPGAFARRLRHAVIRLGSCATDAFVQILPQLQVIQLLRLQGHLETINQRIYRMFPPRGSWTYVQIWRDGRRYALPTARDRARAVRRAGRGRTERPGRVHRRARSQPALPEADRRRILDAIAGALRARLQPHTGPVVLDPRTRWIKLQTNDSELTPYGRGTAFPLPEHVRFVRTTSFWKMRGSDWAWYDNGWNFFDAGWTPLGVCCWNRTRYAEGAAIFSGDPVPSNNPELIAAQLIDLDLERLVASGVRYAVWSLLCFSERSFDEAQEVFAALQWGQEAQQGELHEPSRAALAFPVRGANLTKYVAYLDLIERRLIYMDANLRGSVRSAADNGRALELRMPAFVEYLDALPSVHDLFRHLEPGTEGSSEAAPGTTVLYTDAEQPLEGQRAYVFQPEAPDSVYEPIVLAELLAVEGAG